MITTLRQLGKLEPEQALAMIRGAIPALHADYEMNIRTGTFRYAFGTDLTFEEFLVMFLADRKVDDIMMRQATRG